MKPNDVPCVTFYLSLSNLASLFWLDLISSTMEGCTSNANNNPFVSPCNTSLIPIFLRSLDARLGTYYCVKTMIGLPT